MGILIGLGILLIAWAWAMRLPGLSRLLSEDLDAYRRLEEWVRRDEDGL